MITDALPNPTKPASSPGKHAIVKELSPSQHQFESAIALLIVIVPLIGVALAVVMTWGHGIQLSDLLICALFYAITVLGITVGFHRCFTHKSFDALPAVRALLGVMGSMALQGPIIRWVADHRRHHACSDQEGDPHSPHLDDSSGLRGYIRGLCHAHIGWFFSRNKTKVRRFSPDLLSDPLIRAIDEYYALWALLSLLLPAVVGGLFTWSVRGAMGGFLWGGLVRIFLVHHVTWSVNSICHLFGSRPFATRDQSRNNGIMAILSFGEGWHNNHHAVAWSAHHGFRRGEIDISYAFIVVLEQLRLVWNVKRFDIHKRQPVILRSTKLQKV